MWTMPGVDIARDILFVVDEAGVMVGVEELENQSPHVRCLAFGGVDPDHVGRGIGTALVGWARQQGDDRIGLAAAGHRVTQEIWCFAGHAPSLELLAAAGFEPVRIFNEMETDFDGPVEAPVVPEGIEIRPFRFGIDDEPGALAADEAFADHYGHVARPKEEVVERLRHWTTGPDFDPDLWWLAWEGDEIAGHLYGWSVSDTNPDHGYVGSLGVRRRWRGRGLAKALLLHSFAAFAAKGKAGVGLNVDGSSLTGAKRLYESVGLHVAVSYAVNERILRPGDDLVTRSL
jgi:mycothiol synthase